MKGPEGALLLAGGKGLGDQVAASSSPLRRPVTL
jgi:hypothetical protein